MRGVIELKNVSKAYESVLALKNVSHRFEPARVHALMGKNGSGKSTLIKILSGSITQSVGELWINEEHVRFETPKDALAAGVVTVHQELSLVPSLSIAENIYLGRLTKRRRLGVPIVDWANIYKQAEALLSDMGVDLDPRRLAGDLTVGQQQTVEIIKAVSSDPSILLLDEPTSALAAREVAQLFALVRRLRERGVTIIYITHRMNELFDICDTCTVLRDGVCVGSVELRSSTPETIVEMMFGEWSAYKKAGRPKAVGETVLEVRGLSRAGVFSNVSFDLRRGEILGIAGLLGSGRTELMRSIFGADRYDDGSIRLGGRAIANPSPKRMKGLGLCYTPEDRKRSGLVQGLPIKHNLSLASLGRISRFGIIQSSREDALSRRQARDLSIKAADLRAPVSSLSGGNQQKVVVGNWLNTEPKIIFFDEPTRGIDIQAKTQMFDIVARLAERGISCVFVSSEIEEVLQIADRILVLFHGSLVAELDPGAVTLAELYRYCMRGALDE